MIWVYPYSLGMDKKNPSIAYSGPFLYWYMLSVIKTITYMIACMSWVMVTFMKNHRGDNVNYFFLVMMKLCTLQPMFINILLAGAIYFRYDDYNYVRSDDTNFTVLFSMLIFDIVAGWFVYIMTFSDLLLNYQVFELYN